MQQDLSFGVRQLADVALKALSPGINDPTTAQDALFHMGSLLHELLVRRPPDRRLESPGGGVVLLAQGLTHGDLVGLGFDEVRIASGSQPTVCIYLLEILHLLDVSLRQRRLDEASRAVREQAALVVAVSDAADLLEHDHRRVRSAFDRRFARAHATG
jgi:uncharacterized membrane protein